MQFGFADKIFKAVKDIKFVSSQINDTIMGVFVNKYGFIDGINFESTNRFSLRNSKNLLFNK